MTRTFMSALAVLLVVATSVDAFTAHPLASKSALGIVGAHSVTTAGAGGVLLGSTQNNDDFPQEEKEEYSGDVDWDAEWKKVVAKEKTGKPGDRPGRDFYKSEAEITAIRAANKAQSEVQKISTKLPSAPSMNMQSLTGDWRFWIGIIALISVGSAVLSAQPTYTPVAGGDSYFI